MYLTCELPISPKKDKMSVLLPALAPAPEQGLAHSALERIVQ